MQRSSDNKHGSVLFWSLLLLGLGQILQSPNLACLWGLESLVCIVSMMCTHRSWRLGPMCLCLANATQVMLLHIYII